MKRNLSMVYGLPQLRQGPKRAGLKTGFSSACCLLDAWNEPAIPALGQWVEGGFTGMPDSEAILSIQSPPTRNLASQKALQSLTMTERIFPR
jgi:hypothetical protein